jgi:hypothetical protein
MTGLVAFIPDRKAATGPTIICGLVDYHWRRLKSRKVAAG